MAEPTSAMNIVSFLTLIMLLAAIGYLLAGTKLLKFIQFFLTKKQYKRIKMTLKAEHPNVAENPFETGVPDATPNKGSSTGAVSTNTTNKAS